MREEKRTNSYKVENANLGPDHFYDLHEFEFSPPQRLKLAFFVPKSYLLDKEGVTLRSHQSVYMSTGDRYLPEYGRISVTLESLRLENLHLNLKQEHGIIPYTKIARYQAGVKKMRLGTGKKVKGECLYVGGYRHELEYY